jgi:hypothetical protein
MIVSFRDEWLRAFFVEDTRLRHVPSDPESRLFRKLQMIDDATARGCGDSTVTHRSLSPYVLRLLRFAKPAAEGPAEWRAFEISVKLASFGQYGN